MAFLVALLKVLRFVLGDLHKAHNPARFWSLWNPQRVRMSVKIYVFLRKKLGAWIHTPFSILIFFFWGFTDDILWVLIAALSGTTIFPFGLWTVAVGVQSFVVVGWRKISKYLPVVPFWLAVPLTWIYVAMSSALIIKAFY